MRLWGKSGMNGLLFSNLTTCVGGKQTPRSPPVDTPHAGTHLPAHLSHMGDALLMPWLHWLCCSKDTAALNQLPRFLPAGREEPSQGPLLPRAWQGPRAGRSPLSNTQTVPHSFPAAAGPHLFSSSLPTLSPHGYRFCKICTART